MLKISKPLGVQKVSDYYKFEHTAADQRYYAEGKQLVGEWHGLLAAEFGLVDPVDEEQYNRLAAGQDPWTGEQLIKHRPPAEEGPEWFRSDRAWRQYLDQVFSDAVLRGQDCFRTVSETDTQKIRTSRRKISDTTQNERSASTLSDRAAALLEMHRIAARTFQENLEGEMGERARDYLDSRQVGADTAREFGLGVSCSSGQQLLARL